MKKLAIALAFVASSAFAAVDGTPHDMMGLTGNTATGACQYCHMPHHANTAATNTGAPLWAKTVRSGYTVAPSLAGNIVPPQPAGPSQACLSCHDGTASAVTTQHNGVHLASPDVTVAGNSSLGMDISNDHPVSVAYPQTGNAIAGLATITVARSNGFIFFGAAGSETIECGSCHDPHNNPVGVGNFLRPLAAGVTDFCIACHASK
jgi:predicted CXXCH cytochrome family protein